MELIPEEFVEETWQEVARFSPERGHKEMMKAGKNQPDLLAFMTEFSQDLDEGVKELAIYVFFVVYRMFQKSSSKRIKKVSPDEIMECYESNEALMGSLEGAHERFLERIARVQVSKQPYVMKYVVVTLMEAPEDEEDPVPMTDEDTGFLFLLLKTVVDVLDKAA